MVEVDIGVIKIDMDKLIELLTYEFEKIQNSKKYGCPNCRVDCPFHCEDSSGYEACAMQIVIDGLEKEG